jgi:hypothetical protein
MGDISKRDDQKLKPAPHKICKKFDEYCARCLNREVIYYADCVNVAVRLGKWALFSAFFL